MALQGAVKSPHPLATPVGRVIPSDPCIRSHEVNAVATLLTVASDHSYPCNSRTRPQATGHRPLNLGLVTFICGSKAWFGGILHEAFLTQTLARGASNAVISETPLILRGRRSLPEARLCTPIPLTGSQEVQYLKRELSSINRNIALSMN